jgi:antitoxin PrlF
MLRASISSQLPHFCFSAMLQTMKATLTMTARGVITLPEKLREFLGLSADDQLIAETTPKGLLLRPAVTLPIEMYSEERLREFDEAEAELAAVLNGKAGTRLAHLPRRTTVLSAATSRKCISLRPPCCA